LGSVSQGNVPAVSGKAGAYWCFPSSTRRLITSKILLVNHGRLRRCSGSVLHDVSRLFQKVPLERWLLRSPGLFCFSGGFPWRPLLLKTKGLVAALQVKSSGHVVYGFLYQRLSSACRSRISVPGISKRLGCFGVYSPKHVHCLNKAFPADGARGVLNLLAGHPAAETPDR
jgi:hypothetical protein